MQQPPLSFYNVAYFLPEHVLLGDSLRSLSAEEFTESCELLLASAQEYHCPYWLLDGRRHRLKQPQSLQNWMQEEYFPRVRAVLHQSLCVAFLVPASIWAGLPAKGCFAEAAQGDCHTWAVHLGWFTEVGPARAWLVRQQSRRASLAWQAPSIRACPVL